MGKKAGSVNYQRQEDRLQSYRHWSATSSIDPVRLSKAGFYYTGKNDTVRCFECDIEISRWVNGDDPIAEHRWWSARCRFLNNPPADNVAMAIESAPVQPSPPSGDVCGHGGLTTTTQGDEDRLTSPPVALCPLNKLGLTLVKEPVNPDFALPSARLGTFGTWMNSAQDKERLAEAGFYFVGKADWTRCYHCNVCIGDWQSTDDPWQEHAKWAPTCHFLLMMKGLAFINEATKSSSLDHEVSVYLPFHGKTASSR